MQTRKALSLLGVTRSEEQSPLEKHASRYLRQYEETNRAIEEKKARANVQLPFYDALKRKINKALSEQAKNEESMPVVATFDLHSSIAKYAERAPKDRGIKNLSAHVRKLWEKDPLGSLSYRDVNGLISTYRDLYPKSKAADLIQAEVIRLGYHKLPVAKLARIASRINSQEDYDAAMEANGYNGARPEQVRARSLVRALVAMRTAAGDILSDKVKDPFNKPDAESYVGDKLLELSSDGGSDTDSFDALSKPENDIELPPEFKGDNTRGESSPEEMLNDAAEAIQSVEEVALDVAPPEAKDFIDHEMSEGHHAHPPGSAGWGAEEKMEPAHADSDSIPGDPKWMQEELSEIEGEQAGDTGMSDDTMPFNASFNLTASSIEDALLSGKEVKFGKISIKINDKDEVELWNGADGVATSLIHLDTAIADFMKLASEFELQAKAPPGKEKLVKKLKKQYPGHPEKAFAVAWSIHNKEKKKRAFISRFAFAVTELVDIPCAGCGNVVTYKKARSANDVYRCDCGHTVRNRARVAASHDDMSDLPIIEGTPIDDGNDISDLPIIEGTPIYYKAKIDILFNGRPEVASALYGKIMSIASHAKVDVHGNRMTAVVNYTDEKDLGDLVHALTEAGGRNILYHQLDDGSGSDNQRVGQLLSEVAPEGQQMDNAVMSGEGSHGGDAPSVPTVSNSELIRAALTNYRAQGMNFPEAMKEFNKEHGDRLSGWGPEDDTTLISVARELWTGDVMSAPMEDMALQSIQAASKNAQAHMKLPKIRKPSDHVKPQSLGKDSEGEDLLPSTKVNKNHKPSGKMSDTDLGKDSEGADLLPDPGKPKQRHMPQDQRGVKLPDTGLGSDTEQNDPFKVPSLGSSPSVSRK